MSDDEEQVRRAAAGWFARLRAPDGGRHRVAFARWHDSDPRHAHAYNRLTAHWHASAALADRAIVAASPLRPSPWARLRRTPARALVPAFAVAMVALILIVRTPPSGLTPSACASALGEIRTITLADGTRVTLDTASAIEPLFSGADRRIRLVRGRARFDVRHDAAHPFTVLAGDAVIVDRGTIFDVGYRDRRVDVTLIKGRVEVHPAQVAPTGAAARDVQAVALLEGQQVSIAPAGIITPPRMTTTASGAWVTGMLVFDAAPLGAVLADVNRYSARKVNLGDAALGALTVTGGFHAGDPDDLAATLARLFDLRVTTAANGDLILVPRPVETAPARGRENSGG